MCFIFFFLSWLFWIDVYGGRKRKKMEEKEESECFFLFYALAENRWGVGGGGGEPFASFVDV